MLALLSKKFIHSEPASKSTEFHELFLVWLRSSTTITSSEIVKIPEPLTPKEKLKLTDASLVETGTISPWSSKAAEICKNSNFLIVRN